MEDEFDFYDFSELTTEDLAQIDALTSSQLREPSLSKESSSAGPRIAIEIEGHTNSTNNKDSTASRVKTPSKKRSPFKRFRSWSQALSVSDLVGPAWCELQFDYGLRQKRSKKLEHRPSSFVTDAGKTIVVDKKVAKVNDGVTQKGMSVHKALEREIHPEEVTVAITSHEERWALRLLNMLASVQSLIDHGRCREMPVFGIIHDQLVVGIIDEVNRRPIQVNEEPQQSSSGAPSLKTRSAKRKCPTTPSKSSSKRKQRSPSPSQPPIESFFHQSRTQSIDSDASLVSTTELITRIPKTRFTLHLSDTKTRHTASIPSEDDTLGTRLQLMLYHRLLDSLLASAYEDQPSTSNRHPLDFNALWARLGLDPFQKFSKSFMKDAGLVVMDLHRNRDVGESNSLTINCLDSLTTAWKHSVQALGVDGVDKALTLVYRLRPSKKLSATRIASRRSTNPDQAKNRDEPQKPSSLMDDDSMYPGLQQALQASLLDASRPKYNEDEVVALERAQLEILRAFVSGEDVDMLTLASDSHSLSLVIPQTAHSVTDGVLAIGTVDSLTTSNSNKPIYVVDDDTDSASTPDSTVMGDSQDTTFYTAIDESMSQDNEIPFAAAGITPSDEVGHHESQESQESQGSSVYITAPGSPSSSTSEANDSSDESEAGVSPKSLNTKARVIGTKVFTLDEELLDGYLVSILEWWHGLRAPRGVPIENTRRCETCEYKLDCEWREQKASEAMQRRPQN